VRDLTSPNVRASDGFCFSTITVSWSLNMHAAIVLMWPYTLPATTPLKCSPGPPNLHDQLKHNLNPSPVMKVRLGVLCGNQINSYINQYPQYDSHMHEFYSHPTIAPHRPLFKRLVIFRNSDIRSSSNAAIAENHHFRQIRHPGDPASTRSNRPVLCFLNCTDTPILLPGVRSQDPTTVAN